MKKYSFLLKISKRNRNIIGGLVLLAIFGALFIPVFPAQFQNLDAVRKQLKYQTNLIKSREDKTARLLSIKEGYNSLMGEVGKTHNIFFNREETVDFLRGISDMAERETNNNLLVMEPLSEEAVKLSFIGKEFVYKKKVISLSVEGSFRSIEDLIARFDNYKKLLGIERIRLRYEARTSKIMAQFGLAMYMLTEGETGRISR